MIETQPSTVRIFEAKKDSPLLLPFTRGKFIRSEKKIFFAEFSTEVHHWQLAGTSKRTDALSARYDDAGLIIKSKNNLILLTGASGGLRNQKGVDFAQLSEEDLLLLHNQTALMLNGMNLGVNFSVI